MEKEIKVKKFCPKILPRDERIIRKIFVDNFSNKKNIIKNLRSQVDILDNEKLVEGYLHSIAKKHSADKVAFQATCSLLSDMIAASWEVKIGIDGFQVTNPDYTKIKKNIGHDETKNLMRTVQLVNRDAQLKKEETQIFITNMESPKIFGKERKSVKDIIDDGNELKKIFVKANKISELDKRILFLKDHIKPEIILCYPQDGFENIEKNCPYTGLNYWDIWKYFRLTWSSEHKPTPGKTVPFLIRNKARKDHPIIGIAMLRSAALGDKARDEFIGWANEENLRLSGFKTEKKAEKIINLLIDTIDKEINSIRYDDFKLSESEIKNPNEKTLKKLFKIFNEADKKRESELKFNRVKQKRNDQEYLDNSIDYKTESERPLFVKKRSLKLMRVLEVRMIFNQVSLEKNLIKGYQKLIKLPKSLGKNMINRALNIIKYDCLAENIVDVSVCGSISPYNEIIGGKLIASLMGSKETSDLFRKRYMSKNFKKPAVISSSIKGSDVYRDAHLLCLTTTSLYGISSSQYNRIKFTKDKFKFMQNDIIWNEIKKNKVSQKTAGSGVYHLSDITTRLLDILSIKRLKRKEVNSIFGEGTSPKLRKIRGGLQTLLDLNRSEKGKQSGIRVDDFLQHNIQRKNYIISLKDNILTNLLNPKKVYSSKNYSTVDQITQAWISRWVINRIQREDTLKNLSNLNADKLSSSLAFKVDDNEINLFNYNDKEAS